MPDIKPTGVLIGKDGKPIPGASGILVDGPEKTLENTKDAFEALDRGAKNVKQEVEDLPAPEELATPGQNVDPAEVQQNIQDVQSKATDLETGTEPTDWEAKYNDLSKQMEDMKQKYADRFTGHPTDLDVKPSTDLAASAQLDEKLSSGEDIDIDSLFTDATKYATSKAKKTVTDAFQVNPEPGTSVSQTPNINAGERIGGTIRKGFSELFK